VIFIDLAFREFGRHDRTYILHIKEHLILEYRNGLGNIHDVFDGGHYPALMFVGDQTFLIRFLFCCGLAAPFLVGARGFYFYEITF